MKVFFKQDVPGVGKAHEVKNVADGYARNYLIPRGLAVPAASGQVKEAQDYVRTQHAKEDRVREHSLQIAERLKATPLYLKAKSGDKGRLYGSITSADVAEAIGRALGAEFDKRAVALERPIRELGEHVVELKLRGGIRGQVRVIVEAEA
ncbi:MAG TPA: 50S ribosomal protein L9 [Anaerolineae bacterium]|nr:50S ribosomal protein L9 [Anaerolineae bacterium]